MKIIIKNEGHSFTLRIPTSLIFSKPVVKMGLKSAGDNADIPPEAVYAFCDELRSIRRRYGEWELVDVESSTGEAVSIIL